MSRSSDLVPYLSLPRHSGNGVSFRQGVVVAWDQNTAENVIRVGGTLLENLPCLNTTEASLIVPNDVVSILISGGTWAVMGRFIVPGTPAAASAISSITSRIKVARIGGSGTRAVGAGYGDLAGGTDVGPEIEVNVGLSGRVLGMWSCQLGSTGAWQTNVGANASVELSGANAIAASSSYAVGYGYQHPTSPTSGYALSSDLIQASTIHVFEGLDPGLTTFTMKYEISGATPSNAGIFGQRELALFLL